MKLRFACIVTIALSLGLGGCNHWPVRPGGSVGSTQPANPQPTPQPPTQGGGNDTKEYTGLSRELALPEGVRLGQGFSQITGNLRGLGMVSPNTEKKDLPQQGGSNYELIYVRNSSDLAKSLRVRASASYGGAFGASGSMYRSSRITEDKAYVLLRMQVITGTESLDSFKLTNEALSLANPTQIARFKTLYGDGFVARVVYGAELFALMEFSKKERESVEQMAVAVSGGAGNFSASGKAASALSELTKDRNVKIRYIQRGGGTGYSVAYQEPKGEGEGVVAGYAKSGGVIAMTPEELIGRAREFAEEAARKDNREGSVPLYGDIMDYNVVSNTNGSTPFDSRVEDLHKLEGLAVAHNAITTFGLEARNYGQVLIAKAASKGEVAATKAISEAEPFKQQGEYFEALAEMIEKRHQRLLAAPWLLEKGDHVSYADLPNLYVYSLRGVSAAENPDSKDDDAGKQTRNDRNRAAQEEKVARLEDVRKCATSVFTGDLVKWRTEHCDSKIGSESKYKLVASEKRGGVADEQSLRPLFCDALSPRDVLGQCLRAGAQAAKVVFSSCEVRHGSKVLVGQKKRHPDIRVTFSPPLRTIPTVRLAIDPGSVAVGVWPKSSTISENGFTIVGCVAKQDNKPASNPNNCQKLKTTPTVYWVAFSEACSVNQQ
jgi:hypothetical protein